MTEATAYPKGTREDLEREHPEAEVQTDKAAAKVVPCTGCGREIIVNSFYAPAWAKCSACGHQTKTAKTGEAKVVQAGRTDPEKAANLEDSLINKQFATLQCPLCEHAMELKYVTHNPNYGPTKVVGFDKGEPVYHITTGETVMLQCNNCKTSGGFSTQNLSVYRRQNEPRTSERTGTAWDNLLGPREEGPA